MLKKLVFVLFISILIIVVNGCSEEYQKTTGTIVGRYINTDRVQYEYEIKVSYPVNKTGDYVINEIDVQTKEAFDSYKLNQKVTVYANEDDIGGISKQ